MLFPEFNIESLPKKDGTRLEKNNKRLINRLKLWITFVILGCLGLCLSTVCGDRLYQLFWLTFWGVVVMYSFISMLKSILLFLINEHWINKLHRQRETKV